MTVTVLELLTQIAIAAGLGPTSISNCEVLVQGSFCSPSDAKQIRKH